MEAPLQNLDVIHEVLNIAKLRQDRSAAGLSLQTLLALFLTEFNNLIAIILAHSEFSLEFRTCRILINCLTCVLSLFAYVTVVKKYQASYEYDRDSFGAHPLNIVCLKRRRTPRKQDVCGLGVRLHWLTLYAYAISFGAILQRFRRHALPSWFGFWECSIDMLMALALIPQLHMFWSSRSRRVSGLLGRFVVCLLLAKIASLIYWLSDVLFHGAYVPGRGIHILTETLNIVILLDFAYYYVVSKRKGLYDVTLPV